MRRVTHPTMVVPVLVAFGRRELDLPAAVLESRCEFRSEWEKLRGSARVSLARSLSMNAKERRQD